MLAVRYLLCIALAVSTVTAMPSKRRRTYCSYCERMHTCVFHRAPGEEYTFCHRAYMIAFRSAAEDEPVHPTWHHMVSCGFQTFDITGHLIYTLEHRADARSLASMGQRCLGTRRWRSSANRIFLCGFMLQLYWSFPMEWLWFMICQTAPVALTAAVMRTCLKTMKRFYRQYRVLNGVLRFNCTRGLLVLKNPSERRQGTVRFASLCRQINAWRQCAASLADAIDNNGVDLSDLLAILQNAGLQSYNGSNTYKNQRLLRAVSVFLGTDGGFK